MHQSFEPGQYISVSLPPVLLSTSDKLVRMKFICPVTEASDGLALIFSKRQRGDSIIIKTFHGNDVWAVWLRHTSHLIFEGHGAPQ